MSPELQVVLLAVGVGAIALGNLISKRKGTSLSHEEFYEHDAKRYFDECERPAHKKRAIIDRKREAMFGKGK